MNNTKTLLTALLTTAVVFFSFAQDGNTAAHNVVISIPEVALIDLESNTGTAVVLNPQAPTEAGEGLNFDTQDSSIWLNYSSIVGKSTEPSRSVQVQITSGAVPSGLNLKVVAGADANEGDGAVGTPTNEITLSSTPQDVITGIGSAYTGNGVNKGHNLIYSLDLSSEEGAYGQLDADEATVLEITYTLSDN